MGAYELIDSGDGQKWESFGPYLLRRPCSQAVWRATDPDRWVDASFSREESSRWSYASKIPSEWQMQLRGVKLKIAPTDFGHLGVFPEHAALWDWMRPLLQKGDRVLNLFAYSGGATLAAAQQGASVCHVDASQGMVDWARENAALNGLDKAPIRWIVDDAIKFLKREERRNSLYEGIILDPPTFGRGAKGEMFKIEESILPLLRACKAVLSSNPKFFLFSCHTPGFTPLVLEHLLSQVLGRKAETGEMLLEGKNALSIPCGSFGRIAYL